MNIQEIKQFEKNRMIAAGYGRDAFKKGISKIPKEDKRLQKLIGKDKGDNKRIVFSLAWINEYDLAIRSEK